MTVDEVPPVRQAINEMIDPPTPIRRHTKQIHQPAANAA
jgi:hypothetical protein